MKVTKIEIEYYKSIQKVVIELPDLLDLSEYGGSAATFLLGINESGKSNILEAIAALGSGFEEGTSFINVCNRGSQEEKVVIRAHLSPSKEDKEVFRQKIRELFQSIDSAAPNEIPNLNINYDKISRVLSLDHSEEQRLAFEIEMGDNSSILHSYTHNDATGLKKCETGQRSDLSLGKLTDIVIKALQAELEERMPVITFWKPDKAHLIHGPVSLAEFKDDISTSKPLTNIFHMYGKTSDQQIKREIEAALADPSKSQKATLRKGLSKAATKHIQKTWPELKTQNVKIEMFIENESLSMFINDAGNEGTNQGHYDIGDRSSGFKQFLSLLLSLSANQILRNQIILLDEPDTFMHPGATRRMRDEILKIGKKNHVLVATHSPYMIDTTTRQRHWIVQKENCNDRNDPTTARQAEIEDFSEEIFNSAFGLNIFEELLPGKAIFVEGPDDKELIEFAILKFNNNIPYGTAIIPIHGANNAVPLSEFVEYHKKKAYFLLDDDKKGRAIKTAIEKESQFTGPVWTLSDLVNGLPSDSTIEDLAPEGVLRRCCEKNNIPWPTEYPKTGIVASIKATDRENADKLKSVLPSEIKKDYFSDERSDYQKLQTLAKRLIEEIQKTNNNGSTS